MGLFDSVFKKPIEKYMDSYFKSFTAYSPVYTSFDGGIYEMALTRAAIHAFATHCSKLKPEIKGPKSNDLKRILEFQPNPYQDTSKYLYRLATIFAAQNTAFIAPLFKDLEKQNVNGYYPLLPSYVEIMEYNGVPYLRYQFSTGERAAVELNKAGYLTQFQYTSDFFGESNRCLNTTLQLIHANNEAIIAGAKNSATVRFIGRVNTNLKGDALQEMRRNFVRDNLTADNNGGIVLADLNYADLKQIESKPYYINASQMQAIKDNVFDYFGTNDKILHNDWDENSWSAYYEGKIEPFAIQLGLVMTNMTYSTKEISFGNQIFFSSNRLQYATTATKISVITQMFDRGMMSPNQGLDILNLPHRVLDDGTPDPDGDKYYIRKEYAETSKLDAAVNEPPTDTPPSAATETLKEGERDNAL